jgi:hypothetical protein
MNPSPSPGNTKSQNFHPPKNNNGSPSINEDFAALVFGGYMIETETDGTKYYQLTEAGKQVGTWTKKPY